MRLMVLARVRAVVVAAMATVGIGVLGGIAPPVTAATTPPVPAIFAVGSLLFVFTFFLNMLSIRLVRKYREVYE